MNNDFLFDYEFKSSGKHHVRVYKNRIEITHKGIMNKMIKGTSGKLIIYLNKLSTIEFKHTGALTGYIEFMASGLSHEKETLHKVEHDNVIEFNSKEDNQMADRLVEIINDLM